MNAAWFRWLVLVSLLFVLGALAHGDYLAMPDVAHPVRLAASLALLVAGFVLQAAAWYSVVGRAHLGADFTACLAGSGLAVFTKYVPGKVAVILGRALYLAERRGLPGTQLAALSLHAQLVALWTALLISVPVLALAGPGSSAGALLATIAAAAIFAVLTVVVFANAVPAGIDWLAQRIARRASDLPGVPPSSTLAVVPVFLAQWLVWAFAFALFTDALAPGSGTAAAGLAFPLAVALGIVVVIAPGGLGVQESALAAALLFTGLDAKTATTVAVGSRVWWLAGELAVFLIGLAAHRLVVAAPPPRSR